MRGASRRPRVTTFLLGEERGADGADHERRMGHFRRVVALLGYLEQTVLEYEQASREFMENFELQSAYFKKAFADVPAGTTIESTPESMRLMEEGAAAGAVLHLRIETFYLFAKILLDKLAQSIESYFGQGQAASLSKHSKLVKNLERFAEQKGLTAVPLDFLAKVKEAEHRIANYRDYHVVHDSSPKVMKGVGFSTETGETWIMSSRLYPSHPSHYEPLPRSESPPVLMILIERYVDELISYLAANRTLVR